MKARLSGNAKRGSSTLEMVIAFAIITLALTTVVTVLFGNQSVGIDTQTNNEALFKAQALIEAARASSRQDFNAVSSVAPVADGIYQKSLDVQVDPSDSNIKKVTSTVTWAEAGRNFLVHLVTLVTNPTVNSCTPTVSGDWTAPQIYGYADFPSSAGATGVKILNGKAYVTSDPSSAGTDDFYIFDVSDAAPGKGSLTGLGHFSTSYGLTDVQVVNNYAYVTANSTAFQLLVIDVSDPNNLDITKIKAKKDMTPAGDTAVGNTIAYANKKLYVGLTKSSGAELHIFDVTNPLSPTELGSGYEVNGAINDIVIKNNIAYLATAGPNEVIALNVSDPANPTLVGNYASATLTGQSLAFVSPSTLYFGRIGGTGNPKLLAFDTNNLAAPSWSMNMIKQSGVFSLILRGKLLFITTSDPNDGLQIWDITNASGSVPPTRHDTSPLNIQQTATAGTDCYGNLLYVAQRSQRALQIIGPNVPSVYTLANSGDITVIQGASGSNTITRTLVSGTPPAETLTISGLPAGAAATLTNNSCTPTCTGTLSITTTNPTTPAGTYPITVKNTSGSVTTTFNLVVNVNPFNYTLAPAFATLSVNRGSSVGNNITIAKTGGSPQVVTISASGMQTGVTVTATPVSSSCTPNNSCVILLNFSASNSAQKKTVTITVSGASPTQSTNFQLTIN
jgi:hypothetical protein